MHTHNQLVTTPNADLAIDAGAGFAPPSLSGAAQTGDRVKQGAQHRQVQVLAARDRTTPGGPVTPRTTLPS